MSLKLDEVPAPVWAHLSDIRPHFRRFGPRIRGFDYLVLSNLTPLRPSPVIIWSCFQQIFSSSPVWFSSLAGSSIALDGRGAKRAGARLHSRLVNAVCRYRLGAGHFGCAIRNGNLDRGLDSWFSNRTKAIINNTTAVANAYLSEHREGLRRDVLMMARDLTRASEVLMEDTRRSQNFITAQAALRSMPQRSLSNAMAPLCWLLPTIWTFCRTCRRMRLLMPPIMAIQC